MKRITILFVAMISVLMLGACGDDKGGAIAPIGPGIINPIGPGISNNTNKIYWGTTFDSVQNKTALAQMITNRNGGACFLSGYYLVGEYQWASGNQNCNNYTDAVDIYFSYDTVTEVVELFVNAYCTSWFCGGGSGNFAAYSRSASGLQSVSSSVQYANFGTTYTNNGAVPTEQSAYEVEVSFPSTFTVSSENIPLTVYYGDASMQRAIGTFQLERIQN